MAVSESCSCGASFSAERNDELKLLIDWREAHECRNREVFAISDNGHISQIADQKDPELHIGFRGAGFDE
jgi:hypothetical protein